MKRLLALLLVAATLGASPAWAEIARIKQAQGEALVQRGRGVLPARPGLQLLQGDKLRTGKSGRVALTFIDDTRFAVGPNSDIDVTQFVYDRRKRSGEFVTKVNRGSLAVVSGQIAKSRKDAMQVRTPKTWLGVRGTRFVVTVPE
jgi:hypothetical protein